MMCHWNMSEVYKAVFDYQNSMKQQFYSIRAKSYPER